MSACNLGWGSLTWETPLSRGSESQWSAQACMDADVSKSHVENAHAESAKIRSWRGMIYEDMVACQTGSWLIRARWNIIGGTYVCSTSMGCHTSKWVFAHLALFLRVQKGANGVTPEMTFEL